MEGLSSAPEGAPLLESPEKGRARAALTSPAGRKAHALNVVSAAVLGLLVLGILALVAADVWYVWRAGLSPAEIGRILAAPDVLRSMRMSVATSLCTLLLVLCVSVPAGYALSRLRFPGHAVVNALVDAPIVLPPVVVGVSLLAFFGTPLGDWIKEGLRAADWSLASGIGIVICQFLMAVSYSLRANKAGFDAVDRRLEEVALSLGCSPAQAFLRVTLPLARTSILAGSVMAWARAIGVFGPLMVFVGTGPRVMVMPTKIWLELSVGNIEVALAVALVMLGMAGAALALVHVLAPGRSWG